MGNSEKDVCEEKWSEAELSEGKRDLRGVCSAQGAVLSTLYSFCHLLIHAVNKYFVCLLCARHCASLWGYNEMRSRDS